MYIIIYIYIFPCLCFPSPVPSYVGSPQLNQSLGVLGVLQELLLVKPPGIGRIIIPV
jgi:hypothetical protein